MASQESEPPRPSDDKVNEIREAGQTGERITLEGLDLRRLSTELRKLRSPGFIECDLRGLILEGNWRSPLPWSETTLTRCHLDGVVFKHASLSSAHLEFRSKVHGPETVSFRSCHLGRARIDFQSQRPNIRFAFCDLHNADLRSNGPGPHLHIVMSRGLSGPDGSNVHSL